MAQLLKNNVSGVLGLELSAVATSMTLLDASNFPAPTGGDHYLVTLYGLNSNGQEDKWEIVKVTAKASNTLTITRAQEGTTASLWAYGTTVQMRLTAATVFEPASGGTGATTKSGGFNALSPVTTLGDLIYGDGANSNARLAGNTAASKRFLTQTGNGTASAAPGWNAIVDGDVPSALTGKTYNGLSLTANATGFSMAGGTTSKTLQVNNNLTFSGTDGSTLNIGTGGTLGTGAYATISSYLALSGGAMTGGFREARVAIGASDIDTSSGNYFTRTISGTTTFTVSNVPTAGTAASFILELTNGGSATVNWWSGMKWAGGTAPTLTAAGVDVLGFYSHDGGTTWRGLVLAKDSK